MDKKLLEAVETRNLSDIKFQYFHELIKIPRLPQISCFIQFKERVCFYRWSHYTIYINRNELLVELVSVDQQNTEISIQNYAFLQFSAGLLNA